MLLAYILVLILIMCFVLVAAARIYARQLLVKRPLGDLYRERAAQDDFCPFSKIPPLFIHFILQLEDNEFYEHPGYLKEGIRDALLMNLRSCKIVAGGSTITQQLVKNLYFRFNHSLLRKAAEFVITLEAEQTLGKQKILEFYINTIYFGNGVYGFADAAKFYFCKEPGELTMNQLFVLACIPMAPTRGNPIQYPETFMRIRKKKIDLLLRRGTISREDAACILANTKRPDPELRKNDHFTMSYPQDICLVNDRFGQHGDRSRVTRP